MPLDRKSNGINSSCDFPSVWVVPAALQQLVECGDTELVDELLAIFQTDTASRLEVLSRAVAAADYETVRIEAHTIKGSAVQVGAHVMGDFCRQMESEAKRNPPVGLHRMLGSLLRSFEQVCAVLNARGQEWPPGKA